ncbi:MAG: hypothetical protein AAFR17_18545 [Pseudomonadota bacterium]
MGKIGQDWTAEMTVKLPAELTAVIALPETVTVAEAVAFLEARGIAAGLDAARFHTLSTETRGLRGDARKRARRAGAPARADVMAQGPEVFAQGFQVIGDTARIAWQSQAAHAKATGTWSEASGEAAPRGWRLAWTGYDAYNPATDAEIPANEHPARFTANLDRAETFVRAALAALPVTEARIRRSDEAGAFPSVPLVGQDDLLYAAPPALIDGAYESAQRFLDCWDRAEPISDGMVLALRGRDLIDQNAFWAHTLEGQTALARAARPGGVTYSAPRLNAARSAIIEQLPQRLDQLGYDRAAKRVEFTAYLPEGEALGPRDLLQLATLVKSGLPDGQPVERILVTFATRAMAEPAARALSDLGIEGQYFGEDGAFHPLQL